MEHILDTYTTALTKLAEHKKTEKELDDLVNDIKKAHKKKLQDLQNELSILENKAETFKSERLTQLKTEAVPYHETIKDIKRILKFMDLLQMDNSLPSIEVYTYSDHDENGNYIRNKRKVFFDPLKCVYSDGYSIFNLYIVPNKNRVNKFSLVIRGYSIFERIENFRRGNGYISGVQEDGCNLKWTIKEAASEKELLAYASKKKVSDMIPNELLELPKEFENAKEMFQDPRWQLFYWKHKKEYYESQVSNGTNDPEYLDILRQIQKLNNRM